MYVWFVCVVFLVSGVEMLFGLVPCKTCPLFGLLFVVLFFFFFSVVGMFVDDVFFSFSLSLYLSGAGEPQTPEGFVFPLVFLHPGRGLRLRPVLFIFSFTKASHRTCFFFLSSLISRLSFFSRFLSWFWLVFPGGGVGSVCVSGFWCVRVRLFAKHVCIR